MEGWEGGVLGGMWELGVQRQVWRLCHPPGGLTQWRAGSPAPWNAGSGHILSPKRVPALLRGSWDRVLLGAGRGYWGWGGGGGPGQRGRGPTLVPMSWGSEDCGPEPGGDPRVARGEGRGSLMVDGPTGALWFMKHSSALIPPAGQAQPEFSAYLNVVKS